MAPRVSVVVSTYARPAYLRETLASILAQSWTDLELLVVSDGPSEADADVVRAFGDPRARHLATATHLGLPAPARNVGISAARGDLIAFCDDDDLWLPQKIEQQIDALDRTPDAVLAHGLSRQMDGDGRDQGLRRPPPHRYDRDPIRGFLGLRFFHVLQSSILVRRAAIDDAGPYNEHPMLKGREDTEFIIRLAARTRRPFARPDEPLVRYRCAAGSIARSADYARMERHEFFLESLRNSLSPVEHNRFVSNYFTLLALNAARSDRDWNGCARHARRAWHHRRGSLSAALLVAAAVARGRRRPLGDAPHRS